MPFNTSDSVPRVDISTVLMEAMGQEGLYIAQELLPIYPSPAQVGRYPIFPKKEGEVLNAASGGVVSGAVLSSQTKRNPTGSYNESERRFTWGSYQTDEYGLEERVDDVVATQMGGFYDAEVVTGKMLMNSMLLDFELETAATINNASTFTATSTTAGGGVAWSEGTVTTMDVPKDINACIERMTLLGEPPDTLTCSLTIWNLMRRSTKLQAYLFGGTIANVGGAMIGTQQVAEAFGLKRILVSKKSYNTAIKGKTVSASPVWGNTYVSLSRTGAGDFMNGGVGRTIIWDADSPNGLFTSESYRDEKRRGTMLRVRSNRVQKILLTDACQLITTNY